MSDFSKAVFLSYASQDAEAARRICEALRAAGVEVWFDQSELRGGDAWDAKIRKQIKECALFVPVISANTRSRREGYFRIEWKLAAQRTHAIAEGTPFLLPVVIDDTIEAEALVPGEFREVQWTRLRDDSALSRFCVRLTQLLGDPLPQPARESLPGRVAATAGTRSHRPKARNWAIFGALAVFVAAVVLVLMHPWSSRLPSANSSAPERFTSRTAQLAQRLTIETRDELDLAVERAARTATATPDSAVALATLARLEAQYLVRGWDVSEQRRQDTQAHAKRALVLDPGSADAMFALAVVLLRQGAFGEAETLVRNASARQPDDAELRQALGTALSGQGREAEALRVREENLRLFPRNPFAHYDLALSFESASPPDLESALRKFDDSLALQRFTSTVLHKASLLAGWRGDLAGARRLLDELDPLERTGDRAVGITMAVNLLDRRPERAIEVAGLTARNYFDDDYVRGPKAWLLTHAQTMVGRQNLALAQWREAETVLRQRLRASPGNWFDEAGLAVTLAWLGENAEAARLMTPLESLARESPDPQRLLYVAYYYAGLGDAAKAADCLQSVLNRRELVTAKTLPLDPWWNKLRGNPEFDRLVATSSGASGGRFRAAPMPAVEPKSIAVLAFDNLSDDKANEYFSDGISEELINTLGRVPGLTVKGRTSAFYFKDKKNLSSAEIARQLGVAYLVRGGVRKSGGKVRITAELTRAATDEVLWSSNPLERKNDDAFAVQEEIAALIAQNLQLKLGVAATAAARTVNAEAYQLYLQSRSRWNVSDTANVEAERFLVQALAIDPNFARAHAGLSDVWRYRGQSDRTIGKLSQRDGAIIRRMLESAQRAVLLEPDLAEGRQALGAAYWMAWRFGEAEKELRAAVALNPNYAAGHQLFGRVLLVAGKVDEGVAALRRAVELDPLSSRVADNFALALRCADRLEEALAQTERALVLDLTNDQALSQKAIILAELGRSVEAVVVSEALSRQGVRLRETGVVFAMLRRRREAEQVLERMSFTDQKDGRATLLAALGRLDECLDALETDSAPAAHGLHGLFYRAEFDPIRMDPRFIGVLRQHGVKEAHDRAQAWRAAHPPEKPEPKK